MLLDLDAQHKGDTGESFLSGSRTEGINEGNSKHTICKLALYYMFMLLMACKLEYK